MLKKITIHTPLEARGLGADRVMAAYLSGFAEHEPDHHGDVTDSRSRAERRRDEREARKNGAR